MTYEPHPAAAIFPLMDGIDLAGLVDDVRSHGLLEPIVLHEGRILDGRNRLRACEQAGVEPHFVEWVANGLTPTEWVVSMNLHRRHLTTGQKAALALDLLPALEAEAKEREREAGRRFGKGSPETDDPIADAGRSDEKAAELVGVGRTTVATTKAIQQRDPEIVNRMRAGELNVNQAAREAGFTKTAENGIEPLGDGERDAIGRVQPAVYYGKGDKWAEASTPLLRYLTAWEKRGYSFGHINPREARKRVETIDRLIGALTDARSDLEQRSHSYRLSA